MISNVPSIFFLEIAHLSDAADKGAVVRRFALFCTPMGQ
jgi:hypothetical protein